MFDLQVLAFAVRHDARLLVQDGPRRVEPRLSGERRRTSGFHPASHHGGREERSSTSPRSTGTTSAWCRTSSSKLKNTPDGDANLLDNTTDHLRLADGRLERAQPQALPAVPAGHARGALEGNLHLKAPDGTPMANVDARAAAQARPRRREELRRQHGRVRAQRLRRTRHETSQPARVRRCCSRQRRWRCAAERPRAVGAPRRRTDASAPAVADAAMKGDVAAVRTLLAQGADVNAAAGRRHDGAALGGRARRRRADDDCCSTRART